ncbi:MAG: PASTA domain-containing protein [Clostridiales bacterium]|nr:PASTA domain-containing protein [Clostridiales bacterium]
MGKKSDTNKPRRKRAAKGPNQRLRVRTAALIILILVFGFGAAIARLSYLTIVQGSSLQEAAVDQQLTDTTISAKRGTIYDSNGNVLAESASVWQVVMAPAYFSSDEQREYVAEELSEILGLDYDNVYEKTQQNSYYVIVKRKIESDVREEILEFIERLEDKYEGSSKIIQLLDDYKRYYPQNDLASCVIGFTGSDEQGLEGIEYEYDDYLSGTPGRIITAQNANQTDMPFEYEQNVDAEDGNNLYLTIDETIQSICEKYMKQGIVNNNVLNRGVCIAMDVNTGAILAMVTVDGYDLNDPYTLPEDEQEEIDALPEDEQSEAESEALSAMWRNKAISDTYMPGSVFKICTASMALEEGLVSNDSTFYCSGSVTIGEDTVHCHKLAGHGTQTFVQAVSNSCNPAFIQIGRLIGVDKFCQYYEAFGFSDRTGIDLPGEADDTFWSEGEMKEVDLAVASFGQNFSITPIQMITACAAVANGGYVLQPYVVSKITDADGNVIKNVEKTVKRQVISEETSDKMNEILEYNTTTQGSTAGYVAGYRVAGKTGTSEKVGTESVSVFDEDYIASFCGYAPADDPQIAMLVFFDTPSGSAYYGSQVAAPVFIDIMEEVLPYLEIKTEYTDDELEYIDVTAGDYTGLSVSEAEAAAEEDGFTTTVKGDGETVISQIPAASASIPNGGNVVLYTDSDSADETVEVPSFVGYSVSEVNSIASSYGLNVSFSGAASSGVISTEQDIEAGTSVSPGTVITVTFSSSSTVND